MAASGFTVKKIPTFYVWAFVGIVLAYTLRIFLARSLTPELYGTLFAIIGFVSILLVANDLGLSPAATYHLARSQRFLDKSNHFSAFFWLRFILAAALTVVLLVFAEPLARIYLNNNDFAFLLRLASVVFFSDAMLSIISTYAAAFEKVTLYSSLGHLRQLSWLVLVLLAFTFVPVVARTEAAFMAWIGSYVITVAWSAFLVPWRRLLAFSAKRAIVTTHMGYAMGVFLSSLSGIVITKMDVVIIAFLRSTTEAGLYEVALPIAAIIATPLEPLLIFLSPALVHAFARGKYRTIMDLVQSFYDLVPFVIFPAIAFASFFTEEIITLLFGHAYVAAAPALIMLSLAMALRVFYGIHATVLASSGNIKSQQWLMLAAAAVNLCLTIPLVMAFGFVGAAMSSVLVFLGLAIVSFLLVRPYVRITIPARAWLTCVVASSIAGYCAYLVKNVLTLALIPEGLLVGAVFVVAYVLLLAVGARWFLRKTLERASSLIKAIS